MDHIVSINLITGKYLKSDINWSSNIYGKDVANSANILINTQKLKKKRSKQNSQTPTILNIKNNSFCYRNIGTKIIQFQLTAKLNKTNKTVLNHIKRHYLTTPDPQQLDKEFQFFHNTNGELLHWNVIFKGNHFVYCIMLMVFFRWTCIITSKVKTTC